MSNPLKKQWQSLKRGRPGERFKKRYEAGQKANKVAGTGFKLLRLSRIVIALGSLAIGVVLVFIPGPAILFFLLAGSLLASESMTVARFCDWSELKIRKSGSWLKRHWKKLHLMGKMVVSGAAMGGAVGCAYLAYRLM